MSHPIDTTIVDNSNVVKGGVRSYVKDHTRLIVASLSEVRSNDYSAAWGIDLGGTNYNKDTLDTTTADDNGVTCIVDLVGTRFKIVPTSAISITPIHKVINASGDVTLSDSETADEIEINNIAGAPITIYLPSLAVRTSKIMLSDIGYNAATYPITIKPKNGSAQTIFGAPQYVIDANGGGIVLSSNSAKTAWK